MSSVQMPSTYCLEPTGVGNIEKKACAIPHKACRASVSKVSEREVKS